MMTTKHKRLYRRLSACSLLVLGCLALAPGWKAAADQAPATDNTKDECCDVAVNDTNRSGHMLTLDDIPGYRPQHNGNSARFHAPAGHKNGSQDNGPAPESDQPGAGGNETPTFANHESTDTDPAPANGLNRPDWRPYPWGSGQLSRGAKVASNDKPHTGNAAPQPDKDSDNGDEPDDQTPPDDQGNPPNEPPVKPPVKPNLPVADVPEPPAVALLAAGCVGLVVLRRRKNNN